MHSGYDFGYLLKVLPSSPLPNQEKEFFHLLKLYFPKLFDIKYLMANQDGFHGGLNKLGDDLAVSMQYSRGVCQHVIGSAISNTIALTSANFCFERNRHALRTMTADGANRSAALLHACLPTRVHRTPV